MVSFPKREWLAASLCALLALSVCAAAADQASPDWAAIHDRSVATLRQALAEKTEWVRVHAAEALLWNGYADGIEQTFAKEADTAPPQHRIGVWRVLAQAQLTDVEREPYVQRIVAAFVDPDGPDRLHATETLAKLGFSERLPELVQVAAEGDGPLQAYARFALANSGALEDESAMAALLDSEEQAARNAVAYGMRFLPVLREATLAKVREAMGREPADSTARMHLVNAAFIHGPPAIRTELRPQVLAYLQNPEKNCRYHACAALGLAGGLEDVPVLVGMLDDAETDVQVSAANALLTLEQRLADERLREGAEVMALSPALNDWELVGGKWSSHDGTLTQADTRGACRAFRKDAVFGDVSLSVRFCACQEGKGVKAAGLMLRSTDGESFYGLHYDTAKDQIIVYYSDAKSTWNELARRPGVRMGEHTWYTARADMIGDLLRVYLDDRLAMSLHNGRFTAGRVGIYTSQGRIDFRDMQVTGHSAAMEKEWTTVCEKPLLVPAEQPLAKILDVKTLWKPEDIYIGWPTIARTREGELVIVFSGDRDAHVCPWGKTRLTRSTDGGQTWSEPVTINNTPLDDRDAGVIETAKGTLLVSWFTSLAFERNEAYRRHREKVTPEVERQWLGYWVRRSEDGGATWGAPIRTGASTPHGPIQLRDGRLLYVGRDWGWSEGERREVQVNAVLESRDDGRTWQRLAEVTVPRDESPSHYCEPHVVEADDGTLVALFRYQPPDNAQRYLRQSESTDGGKTWALAHATPIWGYPPHLLRLHNGWLLATYGVRREPYGEYACISRDNGKTWDIEHEIALSAAPNGDLGYPASAQLADGSILTIYYEVEKAGEKPCLRGTHWRLKEE